MRRSLWSMRTSSCVGQVWRTLTGWLELWPILDTILASWRILSAGERSFQLWSGKSVDQSFTSSSLNASSASSQQHLSWCGTGFTRHQPTRIWHCWTCRVLKRIGNGTTSCLSGFKLSAHGLFCLQIWCRFHCSLRWKWSNSGKPSSSVGISTFMIRSVTWRPSCRLQTSMRSLARSHSYSPTRQGHWRRMWWSSENSLLVWKPMEIQKAITRNRWRQSEKAV